MLKGRYLKTQDLDRLAAMKVGCFAPWLYDTATTGTCGCGACALSTLTGTDPRTFVKANKNREHYADRFMLKQLHDAGYQTMSITRKGITSHRFIEYPLDRQHVLLTSQLYARNVATWAVIHNRLCYHNFQVGNIDSLDFLNKPTISCYTVWHPIWDVTPDWMISYKTMA